MSCGRSSETALFRVKPGSTSLSALWCPLEHFFWWPPSGEFPVLSFLLLLFGLLPVARKDFSPAFLVCCSFIYFYQHEPMDSYLILWVTITIIIYFDAQIIEDSAGGSLFLWLFDMSPLFFEHYFTSWHSKVFQTHLVHSVVELWNELFLWEDLIPFNGKRFLETKIWVLDVLVSAGVWSASVSSQSPEPGNTYWYLAYVCVCTHTSIYICLY